MHGTSTGPVLHVANSPGTVGTFLRVQQDIGGCGARYYELGIPARGIY